MTIPQEALNGWATIAAFIVLLWIVSYDPLGR